MNGNDERLAAYADGELDAPAATEVEQWLATDARACRIVQMHRDTTALLRAACAEEIYAEGALQRLAVRRQTAWRPRAYAIAASVVLMMLSYGAGWTTAPHNAEASFIDDVAEYHAVYQHETTHLAELPAAQSDEINRWLGERLQRPLQAPDLRSEGLQYAGARMWISDGKPVADLLYTRGDGLPVALCIVRDMDAGDAKARIELDARGALRVASWQSAGYAYAVVGELTASEARRPSHRRSSTWPAC